MTIKTLAEWEATAEVGEHKKHRMGILVRMKDIPDNQKIPE